MSRHSAHITMSSVHLFLQNQTYLQLVKSEWPQKYKWGIITISWITYFKALKYTLWHYHYVLAFYTRPVLIIWFSTVSSGIIVQLDFFVGFEPKTLCFNGMGLLSSKSCWVTASLQELTNSFLPKVFPSWKMKLLIFTYFTEASWRSVYIYTVLGKCKALWATLRLGLIILWATRRTWAGLETEFKKTFSDNF